MQPKEGINNSHTGGSAAYDACISGPCSLFKITVTGMMLSSVNLCGKCCGAWAVKPSVIFPQAVGLYAGIGRPVAVKRWVASSSTRVSAWDGAMETVSEETSALPLLLSWRFRKKGILIIYRIDWLVEVLLFRIRIIVHGVDEVL